MKILLKKQEYKSLYICSFKAGWGDVNHFSNQRISGQSEGKWNVFDKGLEPAGRLWQMTYSNINLQSSPTYYPPTPCGHVVTFTDAGASDKKFNTIVPGTAHRCHPGSSVYTEESSQHHLVVKGNTAHG